MRTIPRLWTQASRKTRDALAQWFAGRRAGTVAWTEPEPLDDPESRYQVAHEIRFVPSTPDRMQAEVWITTDGQIAVGIESMMRVSGRLGIKEGKGSVFAVGHEPLHVPDPALLALMNLIASGAIAIEVLVLPLLGVSRCKALLTEARRHELLALGYPDPGWLSTADPGSRRLVHVLQYQPWT